MAFPAFTVSNKEHEFAGRCFYPEGPEIRGLIYGRIYASPFSHIKDYSFTGYLKQEDLTAMSPPILDKKEILNLHNVEWADQVQIAGYKGACNSVWCSDCFTRKGGSKRIADRLSVMDYKKVRQIILTVDLKKFGGCPQTAFETIKNNGGIVQIKHNLKRSGGKGIDWEKINHERAQKGLKPYTENKMYLDGVPIKDYVWVLEWHESGAPHWHVFIEVEAEGKNGMIGNEILRHHWKNGLVREEYIRSENHWKHYTSYFGSKGYFDSKHSSENKHRGHQLELPEWALNVTYRIRKMGAQKVKKNDNNKETENQLIEESNDEAEKKEVRSKNEKEQKYKELLSKCGQTTYCKIDRGEESTVWHKMHIPYKDFQQFPGEFIEGRGYITQMTLDAYFIFLALYDENYGEEQIFDMSQEERIKN